MPIVSLPDWNQFLSTRPHAHLLQTGEWGELKSAFGWKPVRIVSGNEGVQILFRKLLLGFTIGYIPKANINESLWNEIDFVCKQNRAIFLKLESASWGNNSSNTSFKLRVSPHNIQPPRTIIVDIKDSEEVILAHMK